MALNFNHPTAYASADAGAIAPGAANASPKFPFTATPNAAAAAVSSSAAAVTDERGRKLVEQGAGSVVVSKIGADVLIGVECNGRHMVRLSTDTALLVAEHIRKIALRRPVAPPSGAAAAAQAIDQAHTPEASHAG